MRSGNIAGKSDAVCGRLGKECTTRRRVGNVQNRAAFVREAAGDCQPASSHFVKAMPALPWRTAPVVLVWPAAFPPIAARLGYCATQAFVLPSPWRESLIGMDEGTSNPRYRIGSIIVQESRTQLHASKKRSPIPLLSLGRGRICTLPHAADGLPRSRRGACLTRPAHRRVSHGSFPAALPGFGRFRLDAAPGRLLPGISSSANSPATPFQSDGRRSDSERVSPL